MSPFNSKRVLNEVKVIVATGKPNKREEEKRENKQVSLRLMANIGRKMRILTYWGVLSLCVCVLIA